MTGEFPVILYLYCTAKLAAVSVITSRSDYNEMTYASKLTLAYCTRAGTSVDGL